MTAFLIHNMAPIMFAALVVVLLLGYPAAFSLAATGLFFALIGIDLGLFRPDFLQALPERVYGVMGNDTLLAIPFFTFMGLILERSGMAEDQRGVISLAIVLLVAVACAYLFMRTTNVKAGADFVILTMSLTVAIAFVIALLSKLLRLGLLSKLAEQVIFVMVPPLALIFL